MKRHESLHPLSRHHHIALVTARKLRRAGTPESESDTAEILEDLRAFWEDGGEEHFRAEEQLLLPFYARYAEVDREEIRTMLIEHVRIRSGVQQLLAAASLPDDEKLNRLGELLDDHVRREERVIFPMMEAEIPEEHLHELKQVLDEHEQGVGGTCRLPRKS